MKSISVCASPLESGLQCEDHQPVIPVLHNINSILVLVYRKKDHTKLKNFHALYIMLTRIFQFKEHVNIFIE